MIKSFITLLIFITSCRGGESGVSTKYTSKNDPLLIDTTSMGLISGHYNGLGAREWLGIRYAQAPAGNLRWAPPVAATPAEDGSVFEANFHAPGCPQHCGLPPGTCPLYGTSEDCLFLDVYAPPPAEELFPVFVWIHGGAFEQGLGTSALYNGSTLAMLPEGVITVTLNYRLGALGFLGSESSDLQGNNGLLDQQLALRWVRDNIERFGGDPNRVTLGGQSAGAMSTGCHMIMPSSAGLFQRALMESNPLGLPYHTRAQAAQNADAVFEYCGCARGDVACMRTVSVDSILDAQDHAVPIDLDTLLLNFLPFGPIVDDSSDAVLPAQPLSALAAGQQTAFLPMLQGSLYDEGQLFVFELFTQPLGKVAYEAIVAGVFGISNAPRILEKYPFEASTHRNSASMPAPRRASSSSALHRRAAPLLQQIQQQHSVEGSDTDGRAALNDLATDLLFYCPLRNITRGYQQAAEVNNEEIPASFIYRFSHIVTYDMWGGNYTFCVGYACHGSELPSVFNVYTDGDEITYSPTASELQLASDLEAAWTHFMYSGDPNNAAAAGGSAFHFPAYDAMQDALTVLDDGNSTNSAEVGVHRNVRSAYCDMWDQLGYFY